MILESVEVQMLHSVFIGESLLWLCVSLIYIGISAVHQSMNDHTEAAQALSSSTSAEVLVSNEEAGQ